MEEFGIKLLMPMVLRLLELGDFRWAIFFLFLILFLLIRKRQ